MHKSENLPSLLLLLMCCWMVLPCGLTFADDSDVNAMFKRDRLVAWCIVPFDARKRTPKQRAEMETCKVRTPMQDGWIDVRCEHQCKQQWAEMAADDM